MCIENLREVVDRHDHHVLVCGKCDHRFGHPSSGHKESDVCPFCGDATLAVDARTTVADVHPSTAQPAV